MVSTAPDVFVSYAPDTKPVAERLIQALQEERVSAWADFKDLEPGQRWKDEIEYALERAHWLLVIVSPQSQANFWVETEWRAILTKAWSDSSKQLLPVIVGDGTTPPFLRNWVSLRIDPCTAPEQWVSQILGAIRSTQSQVLDPEKRNWLERQRRFEEITAATEQLRKFEMDRNQVQSDSSS